MALLHSTPQLRMATQQWFSASSKPTTGWTPLHIAAQEGHKEIISCLVSWGASVTARTYPENDDEDEGLLPIDMTDDEEIKQLIRDEEKRHRDHGLNRAVIPNPTAAEEESIKRARLEAVNENEYEGQGQGQATASAVAAKVVEEEDDDDDSGSECSYVVINE